MGWAVSELAFFRGWHFSYILLCVVCNTCVCEFCVAIVEFTSSRVPLWIIALLIAVIQRQNLFTFCFLCLKLHRCELCDLKADDVGVKRALKKTHWCEHTIAVWWHFSGFSNATTCVTKRLWVLFLCPAHVAKYGNSPFFCVWLFDCYCYCHCYCFQRLAGCCWHKRGWWTPRKLGRHRVALPRAEAQRDHFIPTHTGAQLQCPTVPLVPVLCPENCRLCDL